MHKTPVPPSIELPQYEGETVTIYGERIAFVKVHHSETDNPCKDRDGMGHIYSMSQPPHIRETDERDIEKLRPRLLAASIIVEGEP